MEEARRRRVVRDVFRRVVPCARVAVRRDEQLVDRDDPCLRDDLGVDAGEAGLGEGVDRGPTERAHDRVGRRAELEEEHAGDARELRVGEATLERRHVLERAGVRVVAEQLRDPVLGVPDAP